MVGVEKLSKKVRCLTPLGLCRELVKEVRDVFGVERVSVLFTSIFGHYHTLPDVDTYPILATTFKGPGPIVGHPPCGPWGKYRSRCIHQDRSHGIFAMHCVHLFGGVVEQPVGSSLFKEYGFPDAKIRSVELSEYGFPARKRTMLYFYNPFTRG